MYLYHASSCVFICRRGSDGTTCVCVFACANETDIKRERLWGQAREQLHSEEEFCSADDYTCRADATPAAGTLTAKVTKPGWHKETEGHRKNVCECVSARLCVSLCKLMLEQEVVGCSMKQLSGRGNSKAHCCLCILCITPNHSHKN